jgi:mannose-1-phosphate guanylyltransferase
VTDSIGFLLIRGDTRSAIPANALILASYKTTNPSLLRRRSPTILAKSRADYTSKARKGPEIVEPCFIHESAEIDDSAKIGPNVSIGANVKIGFGARVKEAIVLDNATLDVRFGGPFWTRARAPSSSS